MNAPEQIHDPHEAQSLAAMLGDLIATHESVPGPDQEQQPAPAVTPWKAPVKTSRINEPGPRSLFGEILDFMLAPLLLLWPTVGHRKPDMRRSSMGKRSHGQ